jgi:ketosteroid isomerase-like protein
MNETNIEFLRRAYATWAESGSLDALLDGFVDEEVVWLTAPWAPEPGPHRGHAAVRQALGHYLDSFEYFRPEVERIIETPDPDRLLVFAVTRAKGKGSGAEVATAVAHLIELSEGSIVRFEVIPDREEAMRRASLG